MSQNSKRIWPYSSSRSFKDIDLGVNGKPICDFLLVINNVTLAVSDTVFEIFTHKDRKLLILPTSPLFDAPARGNPLEFLDETCPAKTRGMGLPYDEHFIILMSTVFDWSTCLTDRRTGDSKKRAKHAMMLSRAKSWLAGYALRGQRIRHNEKPINRSS